MPRTRTSSAPGKTFRKDDSIIILNKSIHFYFVIIVVIIFLLYVTAEMCKLPLGHKGRIVCSIVAPSHLHNQKEQLQRLAARRQHRGNRKLFLQTLYSVCTLYSKRLYIAQQYAPIDQSRLPGALILPQLN